LISEVKLYYSSNDTDYKKLLKRIPFLGDVISTDIQSSSSKSAGSNFFLGVRFCNNSPPIVV